MRDIGSGALPICGDDDRLRGMLTATGESGIQHALRSAVRDIRP
jgi:hypothetical protein